MSLSADKLYEDPVLFFQQHFAPDLAAKTNSSWF